ncbi:hypothetical protein [Palleronia pelagia]|uniref:Uncharacterized protein n=1 Tax=Palleronia pelagia TaxID=387096 RepID=A0A1H8L083_9RHOB|nr:hypothetical protein [Palleronia pelagia]SEN98580.1 hypothetical protein SAMN04488011_10919 [Palleronia pelagia]
MTNRFSGRRRLGSSITAIAALSAALFAFNLYVTPLTGVTGTSGALLVMLGCILIAVGALFMAVTGRRGWRWLTILGVLGTAVAAFFLHGWWILLLLAVAFVGIAIDAVGAGMERTEVTA